MMILYTLYSAQTRRAKFVSVLRRSGFDVTYKLTSSECPLRYSPVKTSNCSLFCSKVQQRIDLALAIRTSRKCLVVAIESKDIYPLGVQSVS